MKRKRIKVYNTSLLYYKQPESTHSSTSHAYKINPTNAATTPAAIIDPTLTRSTLAEFALFTSSENAPLEVCCDILLLGLSPGLSEPIAQIKFVGPYCK